MWFKRKAPKYVDLHNRITSSQPPVQAPVGKTLRIRSHTSKFEYMVLEIVTESGVAVREQPVYGGDSDEEVREAFAELVHDYEVEQGVYRKIEEREGEYDQWPPQ